MSSGTSYRARLIEAMKSGPVTLRAAYAMATNKRSAISRLSEMRARGEVVDMIALPEKAVKKP